MSIKIITHYAINSCKMISEEERISVMANIEDRPILGSSEWFPYPILFQFSIRILNYRPIYHPTRKRILSAYNNNIDFNI